MNGKTIYSIYAQKNTKIPLAVKQDMLTTLRAIETGRARINPALYQPAALGNKLAKCCGICGSNKAALMLTECCSRLVCDTEKCYQMMSYQREGQCARNHRYGSICGFHHQEEHAGDWKTCSLCVDFFHPYDYAIKATSMAKSGTCRRYNFDDNVRDDLEPEAVGPPRCSKKDCGNVFDTKEETTRTLMIRKMLNKPTLCELHGGAFGMCYIFEF